MKRLLAVFAVTALLVSMFSNVAFAADSPTKHKVYISMDQEMVDFNSGFSTTEVSGRIHSCDTNAVYHVDALVKVMKDNGDGVFNYSQETLIDEVRADNGEFSIIIMNNGDNTGVGKYWVKGMGSGVDDGSTEGQHYTFQGAKGVDTFTIMYAMELAEPEVLEWTYPVSGQQVVQGIFTNGDANVTDMYLAYTDKFQWNNRAESSIATASFFDDESFGFLFNGSDFDRTGDIAIYVNGIKAITGEVKPQELKVTASIDEVPKYIPEEITFEFDLDEDYLDKVSSMNPNYQIRATIEFPNGNTIGPVVVLDYDKPFTDYSNLEWTLHKYETSNGYNLGDYLDEDDFAGFEYEGDFDFTKVFETGNYNVTLDLYFNDMYLADDEYPDDGFIVEEKTLEFKVVHPKKYSLIYWDLEKHSVGDIDFALPGGYDEAFNNIVVAEFIKSGEDIGIDLCPYIEVNIEGCGIDKTYKSFNDAGLKFDVDETYTGQYTISPEETGELTIIIKVYDGIDDDSPNATFTKKVDIVGWNISIEPSEVLVDYEGDIVIIITDEDGEVVNNAIIEIDNKEVINGTSTNIMNGTYTYSDDEEGVFGSVGTKEVKFWTKAEYDKENDGDLQFGTPEVIKSSGITVVGEEVYTVTSETSTLLNGIEETVTISTLDENGDIIYPTFWRIDIDEDGEELSPKPIPSSDLGSFVDVDGEGGKEGRKITILPDASQQAVIIRATTDSEKKMGEVKIEVQKPQAVLTGVQTLTENFTGCVKVKLVDPRDESELDLDFDLVDKSDYFTWSHEEDFEYDDEEEVHMLDVKITGVDWTEASDDEEDVVLHLIMDGDGGKEVTVLEIPVAEATLTSDPENILMNTATSLTLTYLDAEGKPIEEKGIYLNDEYIDDTDEYGQLVYSAASTSSVALNFKADTTVDEEYITLKVKSAPDMQPPVATVELTESKDMAIVTIKDNVRILKSMVNNELVDMFFPMAEVTHIVKDLVPGENQISVISVDINNNYIDTILTINVDKHELVIEIGEPTGYGLPVVMEDITMVPVRLAEKLGAIVEWDEETLTATYTLGETTISVTVGSLTAVVNGENMQLPMAPYKNEQNRVMVPLRMIAQELGYTVHWTSNEEPITIK